MGGNSAPRQPYRGADSVPVLAEGFAMGLASSSAFLRRFVKGSQAPKEDDPADMGTAFGLEASLGPVSAYPADDAACGNAAAPEDESPMSWLGRRLKRPR